MGWGIGVGVKVGIAVGTGGWDTYLVVPSTRNEEKQAERHSSSVRYG